MLDLALSAGGGVVDGVPYVGGRLVLDAALSIGGRLVVVRALSPGGTLVLDFALSAGLFVVVVCTTVEVVVVVRWSVGNVVVAGFVAGAADSPGTASGWLRCVRELAFVASGELEVPE